VREVVPVPVPVRGVARAAIGLVALVAFAGPAIADEAVDEDQPAAPARHWHGSLSVGASLLSTGDGGDTTRFDASISFQPHRRFGAVVAARAFDDAPRSVMLTAGVEYQAAASRPRLVLSLYADVGVETAGKDPVLGVGVRTTLIVLGPVGVVADTGFHLVIDGMDRTRLVIGTALMLAVAR